MSDAPSEVVFQDMLEYLSCMGEGEGGWVLEPFPSRLIWCTDSHDLHELTSGVITCMTCVCTCV